MPKKSPKDWKEKSLFTSPQHRSRWSRRCDKQGKWYWNPQVIVHSTSYLVGLSVRDVGRARRESSAADPKGLCCTNGIRLSISWLAQLLMKSLSLNCRNSGSVYSGRLWKVPGWSTPCKGSPSMVAMRAAGRWWAELPGSKGTDCRGLRNGTVSSRSAQASVNSPHYIPKAEFAHPEELHKYLTLSKGGEGIKKVKRLCRK